MRLIAEIFGKAWVLELHRVKLTQPEQQFADDDAEEFDHVPVDPHSVSGCMIEHANSSAVEVQELSGAGVYPRQRFGFCGREN